LEFYIYLSFYTLALSYDSLSALISPVDSSYLFKVVIYLCEPEFADVFLRLDVYTD